ncbi:MAG: iron ABC transporter permease [Desulfosarcina sp.]|nr:iron ABC transporter permease [Desulfobacterales bacterium]
MTPTETSAAREATEAGRNDRPPTVSPLAQPLTRWTFAGLLLLLAASVVAAASLGYIRLPFPAVIQIMAARLFDQPGWLAPYDPVWTVVVMEVRLPRILTSALVGAGLAMAGVVFQGILLNPLADPYTLGVSAGAAFGAAVALLINISLLGTFSVPLFAFAGAVATLFLVIYLSADGSGLSSTNLILSGIIVAAILSAGISLIKYVADEQVSVIIFWLMGSFAARTWADVGLMAAAVGLGAVVCTYFAHDLNLLALGARPAASLGVDFQRVTLLLLITVSLVASVCVAVSGIIGFIGLLIPHLMRMLVGPDNRRLLPVSMLAGALLLLAADTLTRAVLPQEIPIGVLTALVGGPFFCYIFRKRQREQAF